MKQKKYNHKINSPDKFQNVKNLKIREGGFLLLIRLLAPALPLAVAFCCYCWHLQASDSQEDRLALGEDELARLGLVAQLRVQLNAAKQLSRPVTYDE